MKEKIKNLSSIHRIILLTQFIGYQELGIVGRDWREFCLLRNYVLDLKLHNPDILTMRLSGCHFD
jgi:hypothetical protein